MTSAREQAREAGFKAVELENYGVAADAPLRQALDAASDVYEPLLREAQAALAQILPTSETRQQTRARLLIEEALCPPA